MRLGNVSRLRQGWAKPIVSDKEPVLKGGWLYTVETVGDKPMLRGRDARTGNVRWSRLFVSAGPLCCEPAAEVSSPVLAGNRLLVGVDNVVRGLDPTTGATMWRVAFNT